MKVPTEDDTPKTFSKVFPWLNYQTKQRPFLTALIVLLFVVIPGFIRIEQNANTAHDAAVTAKITADKLAESEHKNNVKQQAELLQSCRTRNTFQQNTRNKFDNFFSSFRSILITTYGNDPEAVKGVNDFIDELKASVSTRPEDEDRDCNADGVFDALDYLSE